MFLRRRSSGWMRRPPREQRKEVCGQLWSCRKRQTWPERHREQGYGDDSLLAHSVPDRR